MFNPFAVAEKARVLGLTPEQYLRIRLNRRRLDAEGVPKTKDGNRLGLKARRSLVLNP